MQRLGWGIIGCGDVARKRVAWAIQEDEGSQLVAACRRNKLQLQEFCETFHVEAAHATAESLIADTRVDAVYIATPVCEHLPQTLAAAAAGKHVLVEKPMALSVGQCDQMIAACQTAGVKLGVAYYRRFYPIVDRMQALIRSGAIGTPLNVAAVTATPALSPDQDGYWRAQPEASGGGALMDIGSHRINLFQAMFGEIVKIVGLCESLVGDYGTEDTAVYAMKFQAGLTGTLQCHFGCWADPDEFTVIGTAGRLHAKPLNGETLIVETSDGTRTERWPPPANLCGPLVADFSAAVQQDREPKVNGSEGRAVNAAIAAAYGNAGKRWVAPGEPGPSKLRPASAGGRSFSVNEREYRVPDDPVVVICIDGCEDQYLNEAIARGRMPHTAEMANQGYRGTVRGALPSFTNVNNCAIVTGTPPSQTGVAGNFMLDPATGEEVMTNSSKYLRRETILAAAARAGRKVAMVTAKDKLRELLSRGLEGISFSAEKADQADSETNGIAGVEALVGPAPPIYSAEASLYVLRAGVKLLEQQRADFQYLSLTDYMQHKFAPNESEVLDFYAAIDDYLGQLLRFGAVVAITADHGMNGKCDAAGQTNVVYLESELVGRFGAGYRVICPITDPYVVHHGALGSAVMVHLPPDADQQAVARWILQRPGVSEVFGRSDAAEKLELPADRIGDLFVMSARNVVIGRTAADHDLSQLDRPLRSHGGRYEEMVPMILSRRLSPAYLDRARGDARNFDIFDFVCNGLALNVEC